MEGMIVAPNVVVQPLGALVEAGGVRFRVWAPHAERVEVVFEPEGRALPMASAGDGYFEAFDPSVGAGDRYRFRLDGDATYPDPASRFQPSGVHAPSEVVDPSTFAWTDNDWTGVALEDLVLYELHVGTFSPAGTYDGVRERLAELRTLGITAIELMPVHAFPGARNWGYDPAALFAPAAAYGTPDDLRRLVDAAHAEGLAVYLDVVYNHFGPDGAYATVFGPFLTDKYTTPWGRAVNLDDAGSTGVRDFILANAWLWFTEYHIDGLRIDATNAFRDASPRHLLADLAAVARAVPAGPPRRLLAEDLRNLRHVVEPDDAGGYGLDGQWVDDFHHQVRNLTIGDARGYLADFAGSTTAGLATTLADNWFYQGQESPAMQAPRGTDPSGVAPSQCVFYLQNHDQVGNLPYGRRLHHEIDDALYRALSALLLVAPQVPLLFMGQEWAATTPFQYFTDHHDALGEQVRAGRRREFRAFADPDCPLPDPQDPATLTRSRLAWDERDTEPHAGVLRLYRDALTLRRSLGGAIRPIVVEPAALHLRRGGDHLLLALEDDVVLRAPTAGALVWHTEQAPYTTAPAPPVLRDLGGTSHLHFTRPALALWRPA